MVLIAQQANTTGVLSSHQLCSYFIRVCFRNSQLSVRQTSITTKKMFGVLLPAGGGLRPAGERCLLLVDVVLATATGSTACQRTHPTSVHYLHTGIVETLPTILDQHLRSGPLLGFLGKGGTSTQNLPDGLLDRYRKSSHKHQAKETIDAMRPTFLWFFLRDESTLQT